MMLLLFTVVSLQNEQSADRRNEVCMRQINYPRLGSDT